MKTAAGMRMIPVEVSIAQWRRDPKYVEAYDALGEEFERAAAEKIRDPQVSAGRDGAGGGCR
jgi:hypothetical protein